MYDSIIILGPTATGKTDIAISLAKTLNTEIINADSMYIYKDLNVGTAKPNFDEMQCIKHHLIDIITPGDTFNVAEYRNLAENTLEFFNENNLFPIIVGGTGFYIDSLITSYSYGSATKDSSIRENLELELKQFGKEYLFKKLNSLDPETASKIQINDTKRVIRAIEIYLVSGDKKSNIKNNQEPLLKNPLIIGLNIDRAILYDRINNRVDLMIKKGLIEEVSNLYNQGYNPETHQSMKGIGYKEIVDYLRGNISLDESIEKIKQHTRNYAKRQITWFKRNKNIIWIDPLKYTNDEIIKIILEKKSIEK